MKKVKVCFLGAAKRNVLLEQFNRASTKNGLDLSMFSVESKKDAFYPISNLATILGGPSFQDEVAFGKFAKDHLIEFDLIIPLMDLACLALAKCVEYGFLTEKQSLVSQCHFVESTVDKYRFSSSDIFNQLPHIPNTPGVFPKVAKPKSGFGGRGIIQVANQTELLEIENETLIIQDKQFGDEVTLDAFFDSDGSFIQGIARERISVIDGEVNHLTTRDLTSLEYRYLENLGTYGARGPINMQLIGTPNSYRVLEINPRFGGGVTASVEAGFDMPSMIFRKWMLGEAIKAMPLTHLEMVRSRQDYYRRLE